MTQRVGGGGGGDESAPQWMKTSQLRSCLGLSVVNGIGEAAVP